MTLAETQMCVVEKDPARGEADYACHLLWLATEELGHGSLLEGNEGAPLWQTSSRPGRERRSNRCWEEASLGGQE